MKRALLFVLTNLAVMLTLGLVTAIALAFFGEPLEPFFGEYSGLFIVAFVYGLGASAISLLLSKPLAKMSTGAKTIDGSEGEAERWLVRTVGELAERAGIGRPEVAVYPGSANAFATGAFRNAALVAVSTDIMRQMTREELRAVLGHEISHVANGDMVTLCLVQGVLNAFVIFISRVLAQLLVSAAKDKAGGRRRSGGTATYLLVSRLLELALGVLASLVVFWFSRKREYAADAGSARLLGTPASMIAALRRLGNLKPGTLPDSLKAMGIAGGSHTSVWSTHPALEDRIAALQNLAYAGC